MDFVTLIGVAAAVLTTTAFMPQAVKVWRTRSTGDISLAMWSVLVVGIVLWLTYGVLIGDLPLILANGVTLLPAVTVLAFKLRYK
jgi:MtN3 and saliva related transmembrane protein